MTNYRGLAPMKYWAAPASMEPEKFDTRLQAIVASGDYVYAEKIDGNLSRAIVGEPDPILQTRGISVKTDTFGEIQDKVLWWDDVVRAFDKPTVIVGEVYVDGGVDRDVGSVLRSLPDKAIKRQKKHPLKWYVFDVLCYEGMELQDEPLSTRISYIEKVVARIGNPLVRGAIYKTATPDNFFAELDAILARGGEGVVLSNKEFYCRNGYSRHCIDNCMTVAWCQCFHIVTLLSRSVKHKGTYLRHLVFREALWYERAGEQLYLIVDTS